MNDSARAAGYVRVSQERAARNGYGLGAQEQEVRRFVEYKGWTLVDLYREEGVSGYKRERPAMDRLLADAKAGRFEVAVFPSTIYRADPTQERVWRLPHPLPRRGRGWPRGRISGRRGRRLPSPPYPQTCFDASSGTLLAVQPRISGFPSSGSTPGGARARASS